MQHGHSHSHGHGDADGGHGHSYSHGHSHEPERAASATPLAMSNAPSALPGTTYMGPSLPPGIDAQELTRRMMMAAAMAQQRQQLAASSLSSASSPSAAAAAAAAGAAASSPSPFANLPPGVDPAVLAAAQQAASLLPLLAQDKADELRTRLATRPDLLRGAPLDPLRNTLLHWACANGATASFDMLLAAGAPIDAANAQQQQPLHAAAAAGHLHLVVDLMARGADPDARDGRGMNAMHHACRGKQTAVVWYLLSRGLNINEPDRAQRWTPLHWATASNEADLVNVLLARGADVDTLDIQNNTPLHVAALYGAKDAVWPLVLAGVDPTLENAANKTAVQLAQDGKWVYTTQELTRAAHYASYRPSASAMRRRQPLWALGSFLVTLFALYALTSLSWMITLPAGVALYYFYISFCERWLPQHGEFKTYVYPMHDLALYAWGAYVLYYFIAPTYDVAATAATAGAAAATSAVITTATAIDSSSSNIMLIVAVVGGATVLSFALLVFGDPGRLPRSEPLTDLAIAASRRREDFPRICGVCDRRRPFRSKHCRMCDRCVSAFDHHSPWIEQDVGENNQRLFVVFLLLRVVLLPLLLFVCAHALARVDTTGWNFFTRLSLYYTAAPAVSVLFAVALLYLVRDVYMIRAMYKLIAAAELTNEVVNSSRYDYLWTDDETYYAPWNTGSKLRNFLHFVTHRHKFYDCYEAPPPRASSSSSSSSSSSAAADAHSHSHAHGHGGHSHAHAHGGGGSAV